MVFSEDESTNTFFINDKEFDPDRVDVRPRLGTVEEWTLRNASDEQHPFHIHVNDFQVVSVGGEPYEAHGLQDTVPLLPGNDVVIRTRFADFTGRFVFHCHILNHEDAGMMAVVEVVE
jgi:FtsP/CotA-like multicopper oxidase with cupredoxin domain